MIDSKGGKHQNCKFMGHKDELESWPISPVLHNEEVNGREKEKAHKNFQRRLKDCSWYFESTRTPWFEISEPNDGNNADKRTECFSEDNCDCILVTCYQSVTSTHPTNSVCSSLGDRLSIWSAYRASGTSRTSTEDEKSFYDNLCQFCKVTSLERRARKYAEWRRRFSAKLAEVRSQDDGDSQQCTCAMGHLTFMEWKKLYEMDDLTKLSKTDHDHKSDSNSDCGIDKFDIQLNKGQKISPSCSVNNCHAHKSKGPLDYAPHKSDLYLDYGTNKSDKHSDYGTHKSKCSSSTGFPSLTVKSSSLGYNSLSSLLYTEQDRGSDSSYTPSASSEYEDTSQENSCINAPADKTRMRNTSLVIRGTSCEDEDDAVFGASMKNLRNSRRRRRRKVKKPNPVQITADFHKECSSSPSVKILKNREGKVENAVNLGETDDSSAVSICSENVAKIPKENDETFPPDLLSEFLNIARTIDEFYESIHNKNFLENRAQKTSRDKMNDNHLSRENVDDVARAASDFGTTSSSGVHMTSKESIADQSGSENFSFEFRNRIRSLERLCSFAEYSEEGESSQPAASASEDLTQHSVWKLSQQSINLTLSRRSRSRTSSESASSRSRVTSSNGSGSGNSRCSTRQSNYKPSKSDVTSTENLESGESVFSSSLTLPKSTDSCQLGTKWSGSMQWDYSDWEFYYGIRSRENDQGTSIEQLGTIDEALPQDPLDWDW
ncbi:uncharacterized protein LOC124433679 isoform X2 [Xenia sp. Carnegie-2017]|uniref:uncharacterized protein LOC124433679 isoform X2 n=1 Tax=Xenia sp. Carnegie-2017 TaxID=2897299 RepID=UPI001F045FC4|nr:uncharacterized protein LOC124433679 isoform X2 [Xenia sp. Carnegie-2017]